MTAVGFWEEPVVIGFCAGIPALVIGAAAHWRSKQADKVAERVGDQSQSAESIGQAFAGLNSVIDGLNTFIVTLQADARVSEAEMLVCKSKRDEMLIELTRMYRKYGNGDELA